MHGSAVNAAEETKMTNFAPSSIFHGPSEEGKEKIKNFLIGSCIVCWTGVGLLVIVGSVSKLLGLI